MAADEDELKTRDRWTDVASRVLRNRDGDNFGRDAALGQIIGKVVGEAVAEAIAQIDARAEARAEARRDELEQEAMYAHSTPGNGMASFAARMAALREQGRAQHEDRMAQMRELHDRKIANIRQRRAR